MSQQVPPPYTDDKTGSPPQTYPPQQGYAPPPQQGYAPPPQQAQPQQQGYPPQQQGYPPVPVVVAQPPVTQVTVVTSFGNNSQRIVCTNCKTEQIFIDELDAVGGARIATDVHPYARMTLNQLLVELDGYTENEEVVVIGATNFPESLDKALVRPGRFDVKINIPIPDLKARHDILKLYLEKVKCDPDLNIESLARSTLGMTGADLANLVNQAAIRGSVLGREFVTRQDLDNAEDKIRMGPERRSLELREKNKEVIAYHEAGHALVSLYTEGSMAIRKATIIPRGGSLGMVSFFPDKDELGWTKQQMLAQLDVAMGGRAAEEMVFGEREVTAGASSDMRGATGLATTMVAHYGMSDKLGPVYIENPSKISGDLRKLVDTEVRRLITEALSRAQSILYEHRNEHMYLAKALLKYETLDIDEINKVIKGEKLKRTI